MIRIADLLDFSFAVVGILSEGMEQLLSAAVPACILDRRDKLIQVLVVRGRLDRLLIRHNQHDTPSENRPSLPAAPRNRVRSDGR